jgi:hypothetical protein
MIGSMTHITNIYMYMCLYIYIERESYMTMDHQVQNIFLIRVISLVFEFKRLIQFQWVFILYMLESTLYIFKIFVVFIFFRGRKYIDIMIFNNNFFYPSINIEIFLKNIKSSLQIYFNMDIMLNSWIGLLHSKIKKYYINYKIFFIFYNSP